MGQLGHDRSAVLVHLVGYGAQVWLGLVLHSVVAEMGTEAGTELYDQLVPHSRNHGAMDLDDPLQQRPRSLVRNPQGMFELYRIGNAVPNRNAQAAMIDAGRLCRTV